MTSDSKMEIISSYLHSLALTDAEGYLGTQAGTNNHDIQLQDHGNLEMLGTSIKFGGITSSEKTKQSKHDRCYAEPLTRCSVVGSSCTSTLSVHTGPTLQSTHAQPAEKTVFPTQVSYSAREMPLSIKDNVSPVEQEAVKNHCDRHNEHQHLVHLAENDSKKVVCKDSNCFPSQASSSVNPSSNMEAVPSQLSKTEKSHHKKKYDPNVFFKVNGKLYQKLGKIGSGGSSEVHKVISSDCTIYALKKIKLKGRDYPTAHGFCQEIEYLNRLKGKGNIIQLIDYEV